MKRIFAFILICTVFLISSAGFCLATEYAYSYGMDYNDGKVDTSWDAQNAASDFGIAGYSSYYNTAPTWSYVSGNNPNTGDKRIKSEIFFFSGHATGGRIHFHYLGKDEEEYDFHITTNFKRYTSYHSLQLDDYDLSNVKLMTFGGCNTANDGPLVQGNLLDTAIAQGAETAVGWKESIGVDSHSYWLLRYTNQLAKGSSVFSAAVYANSFSYDDPKVLQVKVVGNEYLYIKTSNSLMSLNDEKTGTIEQNSFLSGENKIYVDKLNNKKGIFFNENVDENLKDLKMNNIKKLFKKYCQIDLKLADYSVEIKNMYGDYLLLQVIEKYNKFDTNSQITVHVKNGQIVSLYDDRKPINKNYLNSRRVENIIPENIRKNLIDSKRAEIEQKGYKVNNIEENTYYDCNKDRVVYVTYYDSTHVQYEYDEKFVIFFDAFSGEEI